MHSDALHGKKSSQAGLNNRIEIRNLTTKWHKPYSQNRAGSSNMLCDCYRVNLVREKIRPIIED